MRYRPCTLCETGLVQDDDMTHCTRCQDALLGLLGSCSMLHQRVALYLQKRGIYVYDCDPARSTLEDCLCVEPGLYDVIFGRFETPTYLRGSRLGKRTLRNSTCEIFPLEAGNSESGMIRIETPFPGTTRPPCVVANKIKRNRLERFAIFTDRDRDHDGDSYGSVCKWQRVSQNTKLDWIPYDTVASDSRYAQEKRKEISGPLLWLCRHMNVPEDLSSAIRSFSSARPSTTFDLRKGDLWLTLAVPTGFPSYNMEIVRRRRPAGP